tara:strand:+ start:7396 stop:8340 length:945 start_codon:yes stop_codon:yes gene_type:complete
MIDSDVQWASRHSYYHHSNYRRRSKTDIFFEKCYVRPLVNDAWTVIKSNEATPEQKADCWRIIKILDKKQNGDDNAAMMAGRVVQAICDMVLLDNVDISQATAAGMEQAMAYEPNTWLKNDKENKDMQVDHIPDIAKNAIVGLKEAMHKANRYIGEQELFGVLPGNKLPYSTLPDYDVRGDLKVKTYTIANTKSGYKRASLPTKLRGSPWLENNLSQVAGMWALNNHKPPFLLYASKDDYRLLTAENCDCLHEDNLRLYVSDAVAKNMAIELKLQKANNLKELLADELPDFHDWFRKPPEYIKHAEELWRSYHG